MQRAKRPVMAFSLALSLLLAGMAPAVASENNLASDDPGELATIGDAIFARPALLLATGVGLTIYTATLPFSILGGNAEQAAETLVLSPAEATFRRCLGCTPAQERQRRVEVRTRKANVEKQQQNQEQQEQQKEQQKEQQEQE